MDSINIRTAQLKELPTLKEFEQGIVTAERPFDPTLAPDPISYYDLEALIKAPDAEVLVAETNVELVAGGYVKIKEAKPYLDHERYGYIGFMFTRPEYRGQGIARMILAKLMDWAKEQGLNEVRLEVYDGNEAAMRSYEKTGFTKNLVEMRKRI